MFVKENEPTVNDQRELKKAEGLFANKKNEAEFGFLLELI
jgi:hypothetical protein